MRTIQSLGGVMLGALIIITSMTRALTIMRGSATTDLHTLLGWAVMAVLGLFVLCWGIMRYLMSGDGQRRRPVPPEGHTGAPSSQSRARNR